MLSHYPSDVRALGTTDNTNTESSERLHIDNAKRAYDASNKKQDYIEQMTRWIERYEKIALLDVHVRWSTHQLPPPPRTRSRRAKTMIPGPTFSKSPNVASLAIDAISAKYHAPLFVGALRKFIATSRCATDRERAAVRRRNHDDIAIPFNWVEIWHRCTFTVSNVQVDDAPGFVTTPIANPTGGRSGTGRFDTVLVDVGDADDSGISGLRVARVRVFFRIPKRFDVTMFAEHGITPPEHLAYVEWFTAPTSKNRDHLMYTVTRKHGQPEAEIIDVRSIRRNCQLVPFFGERVDRSWTSDNVLDTCEKFLVNNFQDQHTYQTLW